MFNVSICIPHEGGVLVKVKKYTMISSHCWQLNTITGRSCQVSLDDMLIDHVSGCFRLVPVCTLNVKADGYLDDFFC